MRPANRLSMRRRRGGPWPRWAALVAVVLTALTSLSSSAANGGPDGTRGRIAGMAVTPSNGSQMLVDRELSHVRSIGINTVTVDVWWDVDAATRSHLYPGAITASDSQLIGTINRAHANGMGVILVPKLWCPSCEPISPHWIGKLKPSDRAEFFREYRTFIARYAALAQAHGVAIYVIGHEMNYLQGDAPQWRSIAAMVRTQFHGPIAYGADWSTFAGYADPISWWDAVDVIAVSAYFPLSDSAVPSVQELRAGWHASLTHRFLGHRWFDDLAWLAGVTHRPVLFVEVGYVSTTYVAQNPYDPNKVYDVSQTAQANAYQALLQTFEDQPWWLGTVWWEWDVTDSRDTPTYTPRDKLAEVLLTHWYRDGARP